MAEATAAGGLVEAELQRHARRVGEQGELLGVVGGGGRGHATIMNKGCDSDRRRAVSRDDASAGVSSTEARADVGLDLVDRRAWRRTWRRTPCAGTGRAPGWSSRGSRAGGWPAPRGCRRRATSNAEPHMSQMSATLGRWASRFQSSPQPAHRRRASTRSWTTSSGRSQVDHAVDVVALEEELGLAGVAREPVEHEPVVPVVHGEAVAHHRLDELVVDELPGRHDPADLGAELGVVLDVPAEHVTDAQVDEVEVGRRAARPASPCRCPGRP